MPLIPLFSPRAEKERASGGKGEKAIRADQEELIVEP